MTRKGRLLAPVFSECSSSAPDFSTPLHFSIYCSSSWLPFPLTHPSGSSLDFVSFCQPFPIVPGRMNHSHVCVSAVFVTTPVFSYYSLILQRLSFSKTVSNSRASQSLSRQAPGTEWMCHTHLLSDCMPSTGLHERTISFLIQKKKEAIITISYYLLGMK